MKKPFEKVLANWLNNDFRGLLKRYKLTIDNCGISPQDFSLLVRLVNCEILSKEELIDILETRLKYIFSHEEES